MDVPFCASDLTCGYLQYPRKTRCVKIAGCSDLNLRIARLLDKRWEPSDFKLEANDDKQVGLSQLEQETRFCFDEVRVLVTTCNGIHLDPIAANFLHESGEVGCRCNYTQLVHRRNGGRKGVQKGKRQQARENSFRWDGDNLFHKAS